MPQHKSEFNRIVLLRQLIRSYRVHGARIIGLGAMIQITAIIMPYVSRLLIDRAYPAHDLPLMHLLVAVTIALILSTVMWRNAQQLFSRIAQAELQVHLTKMLSDHIVRQPIEFFNTHSPGEICSRFQTVRSALGTVITGIQSVASNECFILLVPPLLFATNPTLAALSLSIVPLTTFMTYRQALAAHQSVKDYVRQIGALDGFQTNVFSNMRSIKGIVAEEYCSARSNEMSDRARALQTTRYRVHAKYNAAMSCLRGVSLSLCTWYGWHLILAGHLTLGQFLAFMSYLNNLYSPLQTVIDAFASIEEALVSLGSALEFLESPLESTTWSNTPVLVPQASMPIAEVSVHEIDFQYPDGKYVFSGLNATFQSGLLHVVLGLSGSGKTTLLHLLSGLHTPTRGCVRFNGMDIRKMALQDTRSRISVVWQENWLIPGTVWENLTLGRSHTQSEVEAVIDICQLTSLIAALPNGYETVLGEGGGMLLSAGQRQLLAIARALLWDTPILLLDEATANVDIAVEGRFLRQLKQRCRDRLIVIVTHRASTGAVGDKLWLCTGTTLEDLTAHTRGLRASDDNPGSDDNVLREILHKYAEGPRSKVAKDVTNLERSAPAF